MAKSCVRFTPRNKEFDYINIVKLEGCVKTFTRFLVVLYKSGKGWGVVLFFSAAEMERVTNTRPLSLWTSTQYTSLVRLEESFEKSLSRKFRKTLEDEKTKRAMIWDFVFVIQNYTETSETFGTVAKGQDS